MKKNLTNVAVLAVFLLTSATSVFSADSSQQDSKSVAESVGESLEKGVKKVKEKAIAVKNAVTGAVQESDLKAKEAYLINERESIAKEEEALEKRKQILAADEQKFKDLKAQVDNEKAQEKAGE